MFEVIKFVGNSLKLGMAIEIELDNTKENRIRKRTVSIPLRLFPAIGGSACGYVQLNLFICQVVRVSHAKSIYQSKCFEIRTISMNENTIKIREN